MKRSIWLLILLSVLVVSACNNSDVSTVRDLDKPNEKTVKNNCTLPLGLKCNNLYIDKSANTISLDIRNGLGLRMMNMYLEVTNCDAPAIGDLNYSEQKKFTFKDCRFDGNAFVGDLNIAYTVWETSLDHTVRGTLNTS